MKNHGVELTHVANEVNIGPSINFGLPDLRGHKNVATLLLHRGSDCGGEPATAR